VRFVVNTHWHGDHTGGNENLGEAGAILVAHANVRRRMNPTEFTDLVGRSRQAPPGALPVVTFTDQVNFHWNGVTLRAMHMPHAHTDGDAAIHFVEANVLHMGDLFFNGRYPFIDTGSGGSADGLIEAVRAGLALTDADTKIIPGHGPLATPQDLEAYLDMLVTVRERVAMLAAEGMTEDEVVAANPTARFDGSWRRDPEGFVRAVFQAVVGSR
jgi:glyoxylase-like metal-dependent hydrolase (beta-lactamase superfamily II)